MADEKLTMKFKPQKNITVFELARLLEIWTVTATEEAVKRAGCERHFVPVDEYDQASEPESPVEAYNRAMGIVK